MILRTGEMPSVTNGRPDGNPGDYWGLEVPEIRSKPSRGTSSSKTCWTLTSSTGSSPPNFPSMRSTFDEIDIEKSHHNQARIGYPITNATVEKYEKMLLDGLAAPAIVVSLLGKTISSKQYMNWAGNHRIKAAQELGTTTHDAYILSPTFTDGTPVTWNDLVLFAKIENAITNGDTIPEADRIIQALDLVRNHGYSAAAAAKVFILNKSQVETARSVEDFDAKAKVLKIQGTEVLSDTHKKNIHLQVLDPVFQALAELTIERNTDGRKMPSFEVRNLNALINVKSTERDKLEAIERYRKENQASWAAEDHALALRKQGKGPRGPARGQVYNEYRRLRMALGRVIPRAEHDTDREPLSYTKLMDSFPSDEDRDDTVKWMREVIAHLTQVADKLS